MGRRYYSAQKIGQVRARLISNAGYVKPTAIAERVGQQTVADYRDGKYPPHVDPVEVERETVRAQQELASIWAGVATRGAERALELLEDPKCSALQAATVGAIGTDKANLLTGRATSRVETLDLASFLGSVSVSFPDTATPQSVASQDTASQAPLH